MLFVYALNHVSFARLRNYKVLDNVTLSDGKRTGQIDHILIGFFGILFVKTFHDPGAYYGDSRGETWAFTANDYKANFPNPVLQAEEVIDIARKVFSEHGVYNIPMEPLVVLAGRRSSIELYASKDTPALTIKKLGEYLRQPKFEKDNDMDVPKLLQLIQSAQVKEGA